MRITARSRALALATGSALSQQSRLSLSHRRPSALFGGKHGNTAFTAKLRRCFLRRRENQELFAGLSLHLQVFRA